jgi:hypothetical protein
MKRSMKMNALDILFLLTFDPTRTSLPCQCSKQAGAGTQKKDFPTDGRTQRKNFAVGFFNPLEKNSDFFSSQ